jgi:hypothetical protein
VGVGCCVRCLLFDSRSCKVGGDAPTAAYSHIRVEIIRGVWEEIIVCSWLTNNISCICILCVRASVLLFSYLVIRRRALEGIGTGIRILKLSHCSPEEMSSISSNPALLLEPVHSNPNNPIARIQQQHQAGDGDDGSPAHTPQVIGNIDGVPSSESFRLHSPDDNSSCHSDTPMVEQQLVPPHGHAEVHFEPNMAVPTPNPESLSQVRLGTPAPRRSKTVDGNSDSPMPNADEHHNNNSSSTYHVQFTPDTLMK